MALQKTSLLLLIASHHGRTSRPCRDAQDRLPCIDKTCPARYLAHHGPGSVSIIIVNITIIMVLQVISRGMKHRKMGSHELNLESSRSHSIMTVYIDAVTTSPEEHDYGIPKFGKVSFVDLAGSERLKDTKSAGEMLKETANINKSLFTLGKVRLAKGILLNSPKTPS